MKADDEPELWQLRTLLEMVNGMDMEDVEWLLSEPTTPEHTTTVDFWTATRSRLVELLETLESSEKPWEDAG